MRLLNKKTLTTAKPKGILESAIQTNFFNALYYYPNLRSITFAIPNGGSRNIIEAKNLKAQGVTPGVPDVFMALPSHGYSGLFIEFKSEKGRLSPAQNTYIKKLNDNGYMAVVCYSLEQALDAMKSYLTGRLQRV